MNIKLYISIMLLFTKLTLAQNTLTSKTDILAQEIVNFFSKKQSQYYKREGDQVINISSMPTQYRNTSLPYYGKLKYDNVNFNQNFISFTYKGKLMAGIWIFKKPEVFNGNKCVGYFVPPFGYGYTTNGIDWDGILIMSDGNELLNLYNQFINEHQKSWDKIKYDEYWGNFDKLLEKRDSLSSAKILSEEQRKLIVLAKAATDEQNYIDAINFYNQLIKNDPFIYPDAYYNMALIAELQKNYTLAIVCLKKYILINPEAEDARVAKDKIYELEYKLSKHSN